MIKSAGLLASVCACSLLAAGLLGCAEDPASIDDSDDNGEEESSSSATGSRADGGASKDGASNAESDDDSDAEDEESGGSDSEDDDGDEDSNADDQGADSEDSDGDTSADDAADADDAEDESNGSNDGDDEGEPSGEDEPSADGEVVTTDSGTKIHLDPNCESINPMIAGMSLELVGCCTEAGMCGLSNHKLMLPEAFASMFPVQCGDYDMLASFGAEAPEPKSCTFPD